MGDQVIKQPDGLFAVVSSISGHIEGWNLTANNVVEFFSQRAAEQAADRARKVVEIVDRGEQEKIYYQFAMTWDEALEDDRRHGGEAHVEFDAVAEPTS